VTLREILAIHPSPWRHVAQGGVVKVLDGNNQTVELFTVLDFATQAANLVASARSANPQ
jgi:predicted nicotinamide N-methyase